ncbi:hypothetical protein JXJ21_25595 [candidate division KSB1 bacterium]|nr:hypothetical protein [candidate division KSB1 bacterium]
MRSKHWLLWALIFGAFCLSYAQIPQLINYQGTLKDAGGNPITGDKSIEFRIYNTETGGTAIWSESHLVGIFNGNFSVLLGSTTKIPFDVFDGNDKFLAMKVDTDPEMTPRKRLVSVGYAFRAYNADKVDGSDASTFVHKVDGVSPGNGNIDLVAGSNVTITPDASGHKITIAASGTGSGGDDLGNHTATQNIKLNGHWLSNDGGNEGVAVSNNGNVGIGISNPETRLHVDGVAQIDGMLSVNGVGISMKTNSGFQSVNLFSQWVEGASIFLTNPTANKLGVYLSSGIYSTDGGKVEVFNTSDEKTVILDGNYDNGKGRVITDVLEITGGSDLSEQFEVTTDYSDTEPAPGMVVCIDPDAPGQLILSTKAYDPTVAGIISGAGDVAPGMLMRQAGSLATGAYPVALTGRVYCLADASPAPIKPGDLLTTAEMPGYAMKVIDHSIAQGAILGKAMSSLKQGQGLVLVLVSLQ